MDALTAFKLEASDTGEFVDVLAQAASKWFCFVYKEIYIGHNFKTSNP